jgi:hypothetical protein
MMSWQCASGNELKLLWKNYTSDISTSGEKSSFSREHCKNRCWMLIEFPNRYDSLFNQLSTK